jgi:hypothetical protein
MSRFGFPRVSRVATLIDALHQTYERRGPLRWVLVERLLHSASGTESMLSNGPNASLFDESGVRDDHGLLQCSNESCCA